MTFAHMFIDTIIYTKDPFYLLGVSYMEMLFRSHVCPYLKVTLEIEQKYYENQILQQHCIIVTNILLHQNSK